MVAASVAAIFLLILLPLPPTRYAIDVNTSRQDIGVPPVVRGAFHVHSERSDGSGSLDIIADAAQRAGLQFVIITDHADGTRTPTAASYRSGVLCIDAVEISTSGGHYIALGLPATPYPLGGESWSVVEDVARLGGFGVVAHPTSLRAALAWQDWQTPFDAVEWLNGDSQWRDETFSTLAVTATRYPFRPSESLASLLDRPQMALDLWDSETSQRRVVGLGGVDAHARLGTGIGNEGYGKAIAINFPGYEQIFRTFSLSVQLADPWSGNPIEDATALIEGIRMGRTFTSIDALASPAQFNFTAETPAHRVSMGERITTATETQLRAVVTGPPESEIVLLANGHTVYRVAGAELTYDIDPTRAAEAYRVEVHLPSAPGTPPIPWIISNPIYVGAAPVQSISTQISPETTTPLANGERWHTERDPGSRVDIKETSDRIELGIQLGPNREAYVAAVYDGLNGNLERYDGVTFEVAASRPMRIFFELRVSGEDADRRWRRSFYADTDLRMVNLRFEDLLPITPNLESAPNLSSVDNLMIVVDTLNTAPGATATLTLGALSLVQP